MQLKRILQVVTLEGFMKFTLFPFSDPTMTTEPWRKACKAWLKAPKSQPKAPKA